jgi:hypothetical protein
LDIIEWFKYKLKKVFKLYWILIHPPLSINRYVPYIKDEKVKMQRFISGLP